MEPGPQGQPRLWLRVVAMMAVIPVVAVAGSKVSSHETRLIVYGCLLTICLAGIVAEYTWRAFRQCSAGRTKPFLGSLVLVLLGILLSSVLLKIPTTGVRFSDFDLYSTVSAVVISSIGLAALLTAISGAVAARRMSR